MSREKRQRQKENTRLAREQREAALKRQKRKSMIIRVGATAAVVAVVVVVVAVITGGDDDPSASDTSTSTETVAPETTTSGVPLAEVAVPETDTPLDPAIDYAATITTDHGVIEIDLDDTNAPIATAHFVTLAEAGYYDGTIFHRSVPNFVIQGGDRNGNGTGTGSSGRSVVGETPTEAGAAGYPVGSLAAAKTGQDPDGTFDSQFFIVTGDGTPLGTSYARFGSVTSGQDVAQAIEDLNPGGDGPPTETVTIESIVIVKNPRSGDSATTVAP